MKSLKRGLSSSQMDQPVCDHIFPSSDEMDQEPNFEKEHGEEVENSNNVAVKPEIISWLTLTDL